MGEGRSTKGRRILVGLASLAVAIASFLATTWIVRGMQGPDSGRAPLPPWTRSTPQARDDAPPRVAAAPTARMAGEEREDAMRAAARAAEAAEEEARSELFAEAESADESLEVRLDLYRDALRGALEASGDAAFLDYHGMWTEHFLRLDAVQAELAALPPTDRASALASIRREMGFAPEAIERLAERDARLEARWQRGYAYMEERRRLEATFEGAALATELRELRERVFGHEARTIEREEADGFFRYERRRIYGRN